MKEMKEKNNKKTSKALIPIIIGAGVLVIGCVVAVLLIFSNPQNRLEAKLDQAEKLLSEQKYEEALLAYREIASENVDCEAAYAGVSEVYRAQAANASTVEEAMGCFAKEESEVTGFQYTEADLLILTEVASKDIQNANVVLDFMDTLKEENPEITIPQEAYISLAVQYMDEAGDASVYEKYSQKIYEMDPTNPYAIYYACVCWYMDVEGVELDLLEMVDCEYHLSNAMNIMGTVGSTHCSVRHYINDIAKGREKEAILEGFVYNEHGDDMYATWVGNIVYQDDAHDVYYTYDERGEVLTIDAAGYTWGGGDNETLEVRYTYRENGQPENVMVNGSLYQEYRYDESDRIVYKYDNSFYEAAKTSYTYHDAEGYVDCRTEYIPIDWDDDGVYEEKMHHCGAIVQNTVLEDGTKINVVADVPSPMGELIVVMPDGNRLNMWMEVPVDGTFAVEHTEGEFVSPKAIAPGYAGDTYTVTVSDAKGRVKQVYTYIYDEYGLLQQYRIEVPTESGELRLEQGLCYLTEVSEDESYIIRVEMYYYNGVGNKLGASFGEICEIIYFK